MTDDIEQKLDKLTIMMSKLVTEDEGQSKQFKPHVYQSKRGRGQNRGRFRLEMHIKVVQDIIKTLEVE